MLYLSLFAITLDILSSSIDEEKGTKRTFFLKLKKEQSLIDINTFQKTIFYEANSSLFEGF
jgi:hypothetical protein